MSDASLRQPRRLHRLMVFLDLAPASGGNCHLTCHSRAGGNPGQTRGSEPAFSVSVGQPYFGLGRLQILLDLPLASP